MNASTELSSVDSGAEAGDARANMQTITLARATSRKIGCESATLEARFNSLKVLALSLLREVESLEKQDATGTAGALNLRRYGNESKNQSSQWGGKWF